MSLAGYAAGGRKRDRLSMSTENPSSPQSNNVRPVIEVPVRLLLSDMSLASAYDRAGLDVSLPKKGKLVIG